MLSEREVHLELRELLMNNEPFQHAYLIKFERPSRPDELSGKVSTSAHRYTYLTDASRDVDFNDWSFDLNGAQNGAQTYIANKVLAITDIQESVEAKGDTCSITLDGNGIGGSVSGSVVITSVDATTWDLQCVASMNPIAQGLRPGDKIELAGDRTGSFNIYKFRENNTIRVKKIDDSLTTGTVNISIALSSEEIKSILLNKNDANYASFVNREIVVYRAYFKDGVLVGATPDIFGNIGPILLFRGIINNVSFDDDDNGVKVQWGVTSHWGDFSQVRGRITSDEFHRALDANGIPQPDSAIKSIYAYDKGFAHSETSLNLLASYSVMVDKTTIEAKKGFFGIGAKTKVKTVPVAEGRSTALDFQLQAKSIPIGYGVRSLPGIPIFADTLNNNSSEVYVVYALSEGEIGGLYDVIIDGNSLICNNKEDSDIRSAQTTENTVDLICRGRADRGDVLGGEYSNTVEVVDYYYEPAESIDYREEWGKPFNRNAVRNYHPYLEPSSNIPVSSGGITHGESVALSAPQEIILDFFSGTEGQKAASQLVDIARAKNFKVQNDYWTGSDTAEYWGPNHRLADTAYVVARFRIKEGETTIPSIEYIVRCKVVSCYNYDYSYSHDDKMSAESADNFLLGDTVTLSTGQSVQIIDKWTLSRPDGILETRFRYSVEPDLQYVEGVPNITRFSMTKGANTWTMVTYNWVINSGTVGAEISAVATFVDNGTDLTITYPSTPNIIVGGEDDQPSPILSLKKDGGKSYRNALLMSDSLTATQLTTGFY